jgi:membrane fusion protein (multidrug efflux system)
MEYLYKEGAVSESQFDGARTQFEVSKANYEAVQRLVEIHAPIAGNVTAIDVSPGAQVATGQRVAVVATTDSLRVKFGVNAENIGDFQIGADVTISADAIADRAAGKVVAKASSADPTNRTFEVEALIDNAAGVFRPGMFVKVHLVREHLVDVIVVPREAVVVLENQPVVFTCSGGIARKQPVGLGTDVDGHVVITSGLNAGDTLVTLGQTYLDDGFKVAIANLERGTL